MAIIIANANAISMLDDLVDAIDAGTGAGDILIYDDTGTIPADCAATNNTNVLLATCPLNATAFGASSDGTGQADAVMATSPAVEDTSAIAGDMSYFRIVDGDGLVLIQGTIGTSGQDLNFNTITVATNDTVTVTGLTLSLPEQ